jgi:hypothetical protein
MSEFARSHGLVLQRLSYWRARLREWGQTERESERKAPLRLVPVVATVPVRSATRPLTGMVQIHCPNGVTVTVAEPERTCAQWVAEVVRALEASER